MMPLNAQIFIAGAALALLLVICIALNDIVIELRNLNKKGK